MIGSNSSEARGPVTAGLITANLVASLAMLAWASPDSQALAAWAFGLVPVRLTLALQGHGQGLLAIISLFSHMFVHGSWLHLGMNMLMLLAMGRLLEPVLGSARFALLYLAAGVAGGLAEWAWAPHSADPAIGASGAVSGLIAVQAMLFGRSRLGPAGQAIGLGVAWLLLQIGAGVALGGPGFRLAVAAHVGGFVVGLALARPLAGRSIDRNAGS